GFRPTVQISADGTGIISSLQPERRAIRSGRVLRPAVPFPFGKRSMLPRRRFLQAAALSTTAFATAVQNAPASDSGQSPQDLDAELTRILNAPVLQLEHLKEPLKIASIELLRAGDAHLLRTRSSSGLEVITVPHQAKIGSLAPILLGSVVPAFL